MKRYILLVMTAAALVACGFLEENNTSYPTADSYYTSAEKIRTGLNGLYDPVRNIYSAAMFLMTEAATDVIFLSSYTRPDANCVISPSNPCHGKNVWKQELHLQLFHRNLEQRKSKSVHLT